MAGGEQTQPEVTHKDQRPLPRTESRVSPEQSVAPPRAEQKEVRQVQGGKTTPPPSGMPMPWEPWWSPEGEPWKWQEFDQEDLLRRLSGWLGMDNPIQHKYTTERPGPEILRGLVRVDLGLPLKEPAAQATLPPPKGDVEKLLLDLFLPGLEPSVIPSYLWGRRGGTPDTQGFQRRSPWHNILFGVRE